MFIALTESFESDDPRPGIYSVDKIESILNEGESLALWGQSHEAPSAIVKGKRRAIFLAWIKAGMPIVPDVPGGILMTLERRAWEKTAEPATKAEAQPTIVGPKREAVELTAQQGFDCWHMLSNCASGEEPGAIQAWLAKNSLRLVRDTPSEAETRHYHPRLPGFGYDGKIARVIRCSGCGEMLTGLADSRWRVAGDHWEHQCGDAQAGHHQARDFGPIAETQPPLQWVDWHEGMTLEDGCYPVMVRTSSLAATRWRRGGKWWNYFDVECVKFPITHYLPIRIPDPPKRD